MALSATPPQAPPISVMHNQEKRPAPSHLVDITTLPNNANSVQNPKKLLANVPFRHERYSTSVLNGSDASQYDGVNNPSSFIRARENQEQVVPSVEHEEHPSGKPYTMISAVMEDVIKRFIQSGIINPTSEQLSNWVGQSIDKVAHDQRNGGPVEIIEGRDGVTLGELLEEKEQEEQRIKQALNELGSDYGFTRHVIAETRQQLRSRDKQRTQDRRQNRAAKRTDQDYQAPFQEDADIIREEFVMKYGTQESHAQFKQEDIDREQAKIATLEASHKESIQEGFDEAKKQDQLPDQLRAEWIRDAKLEALKFFQERNKSDEEGRAAYQVLLEK